MSRFVGETVMGLEWMRIGGWIVDVRILSLSLFLLATGCGYGGPGPLDRQGGGAIEVIVQSPPCEAVCGGLLCGPDGCGGSCGVCEQGELCTLEGACEIGTREELDEGCAVKDCIWTCGLWDEECLSDCSGSLAQEESALEVEALECIAQPCTPCEAASDDEEQDCNLSPCQGLSEDGEQLCDLKCLFDECTQRHASCVTGEGGCWGLSLCVKSCTKKLEGVQGGKVEKDICVSQCWISATFDAQSAYLDLIWCLFQQCADDMTCIKEQLFRAETRGQGACADKIHACQGI
jgi:hypothetical protein